MDQPDESDALPDMLTRDAFLAAVEAAHPLEEPQPARIRFFVFPRTWEDMVIWMQGLERRIEKLEKLSGQGVTVVPPKGERGRE